MRSPVDQRERGRHLPMLLTDRYTIDEYLPLSIDVERDESNVEFVQLNIDDWSSHQSVLNQWEIKRCHRLIMSLLERVNDKTLCSMSLGRGEMKCRDDCRWLELAWSHLMNWRSFSFSSHWWSFFPLDYLSFFSCVSTIKEKNEREEEKKRDLICQERPTSSCNWTTKLNLYERRTIVLLRHRWQGHWEEIFSFYSGNEREQTDRKSFLNRDDCVFHNGHRSFPCHRLLFIDLNANDFHSEQWSICIYLSRTVFIWKSHWWNEQRKKRYKFFVT